MVKLAHVDATRARDKKKHPWLEASRFFLAPCGACPKSDKGSLAFTRSLARSLTPGRLGTVWDHRELGRRPQKHFPQGRHHCDKDVPS